MFRTLFLVLLAGLLVGGVGAFQHYNSCWSADLNPRSAWYDLDPRYIAKKLGAAARMVRQYVIWGNDHGTSVVLMTVADPLFRHPPLDQFQDQARRSITSGHRIDGVRECRAFETDEATWTCLGWNINIDGISGRQRAYFAARGSTKLVVLFTAIPPSTFSRFDRPIDWLARMEWKGPGITQAY